jgi:hypothetical protein
MDRTPRLRARWLAIGAAMLAIGACGGPSGASPAASAVGASSLPGVTTPAPASMPIASVEPEGSDAAGGGITGDGCSLLSDQDVAAIVGQVITSKEERSGGVKLGCHYVLAPANKNLPVDGEVTLEIVQSGGAAWLDDVRASFEMEKASGIGDDGSWGFADELYVRSGDALVTVQVIVPGAEDFVPRDAELELASRLLELVP